MINPAERVHSLEEKFSVFGFSLRSIPPSTEKDKYGGFFEVSGKGEKVVNFLQEFVEAANCYEKYRLQSMRRQVGVFNRKGHSTMDVEFKNHDNETRLIRVQSYGPNKEGDVELTFGGGGNITTFEEMKYVLERTADKTLSATTN